MRQRYTPAAKEANKGRTVKDPSSLFSTSETVSGVVSLAQGRYRHTGVSPVKGLEYGKGTAASHT